MDRLESLGNALSNVTMYDIKSMYNQARNMVLNVSEMEAKVREATNDEPWGASSTLMQEIAAGTHNFQQFNEIMPCIYSRFMDKEARQWREIYKALQLLEYIIKHGSERVVDDARSHLSTIKMLRNFHYIDEKGKDQGINVRNRAKELTTLLMDVDMIRTERRKAKANRNKYVGTGNDATSFGSGRYGGFGSDTFGSGRGYGGGSYDSGYGGYGGGSGSGGFRDDRRGFDEYNAGDDEIPAPRRSNSVTASGVAGGSRTSTSTSANNQTTTSKQQEKVVDLLGFDDEDYSNQPATAPPTIASPPTGTATLSSAAGKAPEKALPSNPLDDGDDDFADFQTAPVSAPVSPAPTTNKNNNIFAALAQAQSPSAPQQRPVQPVGGFGVANAVGGGVGRPASVTGGSTTAPLSPLSASANRTGFGVTSTPSQPSSGVLSPILPTLVGAGAKSGVQTTSAFSSVKSSGSGSGPARGASAGFDDLWSMSLGSSKTAHTQPAGGIKSMKDLEKEKAQASIWGAGSGKSNANSMGHGLGTGSVSGTFGLSGNGTTGGGSGGSGGDDLLL